MFGELRSSISIFPRITRHSMRVLGVCAGLCLGVSSFAGAQTLFTTTSDFTGWGNDVGGVSNTPTTAWDFDGSTTNGAGNSTNPGGTGTAGSLAISGPEVGYGNIVDIGESTNQAFLSVLDPGSTAVSYPPPNYSQVDGTLTAYSGTLSLAYTIPTNTGGSYFEIGVGLNYDGHGYNPFLPSSNSFTTVDGLLTGVATIPYTISAGSISYFDFQLWSNTNYATPGTFYVDDIQVNQVPEPASMGLVGAGMALLGLRRRRGKSVTI